MAKAKLGRNISTTAESETESSGSPLSSPPLSDLELEETSTQVSRSSQGRKQRGAAIAATAKRRAAEDSDVSEEEVSRVKVTKKARRGTVVRRVDEESDFEVKEEELEVTTEEKNKRRKSGKVTEIKTEEVIRTVVKDDSSQTTVISQKVQKKTVKVKEGDNPETPKRKRKTKEEKEREKMPLAVRTLGCAYKIGAHVSSAAGVENSVTNAVRIGANSFALFLKSQRKWESPAYKAANITAFKRLTKTMDYDPRRHMLPHGSYLVNLAQKDKEKATKAYVSFLDDLKRAEMLDIGLFNFHPGSTLGEPRPEAIQRIATALNKAHKETKFVKTVLETMAGQGNVIGCKFEDLRDIINLVHDKSRVGVCIDTCHSFSAGYDLRTPTTYAAVMAEFDKIIGFKYLSALHLNDSKAPFNSHRDLHQNIGLGFLGLSAFRNVMNTKEFEGIPMVLETPLVGDDVSTWAKEIKLLESLVGLEPDNEKFLELEKELAEKGRAEREEVTRKLETKLKEKEEKEAKKEERARAKEEKAKKKKKGGGRKKKEVIETESGTETQATAESDSDLSSCAGHLDEE